MCDFAFPIDIAQHINGLDMNLQEATYLIDEMFTTITALERKHQLWELQLRSNNMTHFPIMRNGKSLTKEYVKKIQLLQQELNSRFQDTRLYVTTVTLCCHFDVNIETVPVDFQTEMKDLQCFTDPRNNFNMFDPFSFV
jgi:hypothetical protein